METQEPDLEACRELFTELEFTSMLKELAPAPEASSIELIEEPTAEQTATFYAAARQHGFAFALDATPPPVTEPRSKSNRERPAGNALAARRCRSGREEEVHFTVGVCAEAEIALRLPLTPELRALLEDAAVPKRIHD